MPTFLIPPWLPGPALSRPLWLPISVLHKRRLRPCQPDGTGAAGAAAADGCPAFIRGGSPMHQVPPSPRQVLGIYRKDGAERGCR